MTMPLSTNSSYSVKEEIASSITHGLGVVFGVAALLLLILKAMSEHADALTFFSYSIYGVSIILLYLASTLYHAIPSVRAKRMLKTFDHCAIYLLIAGTYTPLMLVGLKTPLAMTVLAIIWGVALVGVVLKVAFVYRFKALSLGIYLAMGWLSVVVLYQLVKVMPTAGLVLLGMGGVVYSLGVFFYVKHTIPYNHAIWHLFVLGGTILHFLAIYYYVVPAP